MADKKFPKSGLPVRKTVDLLPAVFRTPTNDKFLSGVLDPLVQPGVLEKTVGYIGRRYGKTFNGKDVYLDTDNTLRSRYQLEPGVVYSKDQKILDYYDYLDFKNQLKFFGNNEDRDDLFTSQEHYTWNPPIDWDKFVNYREYFWAPEGPPSVQVYGQSASIVSTYKVKSSVNSFIFTPDGYTNNPSLTLYRGQTYKFVVNLPNDGFAIRSSYDTGSLTYDPNRTYFAGSVVVYDNKLWKAKVEVLANDGSSIDINSQDWEFVEIVSSQATSLDYNQGVTNNKIENGTVTFTVPYDAPDILYYQSVTSPDKFGRFVIADIESNTKINIDKEILGKTNYQSSNGVKFTNGLVVEFMGNVTPEKYSSDSWLVEGVGNKITLTKFSDLVVPVLSTDLPEVLFDNEGFDTQPFDDASAYPGTKDYITISKDSKDINPWSRYNRWFHRSVLEYSYKFRGQDFDSPEASRAKRPIIEFLPNIKLFNHGYIAKATVDYIDDFTDDIFSKIEGSTGYNIDGEFVFEGARVLVIADTDALANNKIYRVTFITHNNRRQISLKEEVDSLSTIGECVLIRRGNNNAGSMFHYNGTAWIKSQEKTSVNQAPLFDVFDENGVSFSDPDTYPVSSFNGTKLMSYKVGNTALVDKELGFVLSYQKIDNVGDILFNWDWDSDIFYYTVDQTRHSKKISTGFYEFSQNSVYENAWIKLANTFVQPIVDSQIVSEATSTLTFKTIYWTDLVSDPIIRFYINGNQYTGTYTRQGDTFTFDHTFSERDVVSVKIITDVEPDQGYYEIPAGLEKNPFNNDLTEFTLGQAIDHVVTSIEFDDDFSGVIPGASNLRDLFDHRSYGKRFLKHSGIAPISISLLCDKTNNIIKALQYANKSYTTFKNNFLQKATEIDFNNNIANFVDDIVSDLGRVKSRTSPFADSDMIGSGAYNLIRYVVEDEGIKTFSLSEKFNLTELSRRAVYVYINNQQLLNSRDYEFDSTFGFLKLNVNLQIGSVIEVREYVTTSGCYIPPTPTAMGLYKKYTPMKFLDDTYQEPRYVIQGHDGSITATFGDYRDDLLLELEYRIYNNIKTEYDPSVFDIDTIVGGYNGYGLYKKPQLDEIISQNFLKWIMNTSIDYINNDYFDSQNSFTYTYSNMTDPTGLQNLPGFWRGVYQWFYDTDRPHRCPWEMLGFSEKPTWWEDQYGPAPYTKNNLLLWEDLRDGIIRQGPRAGTYDRYKRPTIMGHIPTDEDGKLLSPLESGLAGNFTLVNNRGPFKLGDVAPVEYAWRSSSEWPFSIVMAMCLMKPFEYITTQLDTSKTITNKLDQTVNASTKLFSKLTDTIDLSNDAINSGLIQYLIAYVKSKGLDTDSIVEIINNLDVRLSSRLSGFVDKAQQKYLLDSKSPSSSSSTVFVPAENYDIIFNVSTPISSITYSGVILEKTEGGWTINGYDDVLPYFNYYAAVPNQRDPLMSVGGVSERFLEWEADKLYNNGQLVRYQNVYFRALRTHTSTDEFDSSLWSKLTGIPQTGGVEAFRRRNFNTLRVQKLSYGTRLSTIQSVVDFLLGYEQYLKSVGFKFDNYNPEIQANEDWSTAAKEFLFWTKQNWMIGSLLTLSPAANKLYISTPVGVSDSLLDSFYDYNVLKVDGKPLIPAFINVNREFQSLTIETTNTTDGIYYLKLYYVLKEHVAVFTDKTVFNDVIYDKTTGYRQERIKTQGYRTIDWDGDYTSPGFLFDNVNIDPWMPWTDYKLGDIVSYRSYNWTSLQNQNGTELFDETRWTKLDSTPEKQLIPNFDFKINQIYDYYNVDSQGIGESQRALARHTVGYQQREYLQNLAEDPVTQFQLYQGFIREKGTINSVTKVFDKLSRTADTSIDLNEEWAFRLGRLGGVDQVSEVEFTVLKQNFELNPQPLLFVEFQPSVETDQNYRIVKADFTIEPIPYTTNINPVSFETKPIKTAGYVNNLTVDYIIKSRENLSDLNIEEMFDNCHIWVTFDGPEWQVLRFNQSPLLTIEGIIKTGTAVTITLSRSHNFVVGDYIGIKDVINLTGFFKITEIDTRTVTVTVAEDAQDPEYDISSITPIYILTESRFKSYEDINPGSMALLKDNSKLWIDNNGSDLWEVINKKNQYTDLSISEYGITTPLYAGTKVLYDDNLKQVISSIPGSGYVMCYVEGTTGLVLKQIVAPPSGIENSVRGSFGAKMAITPDSRFLIVASPSANNVPSDYVGEFDNTKNYLVDDVVLYQGKLWKAVQDVRADGSTADFDTSDWTIAVNIPATPVGSGFGSAAQGMISIYEYVNQQWTISESFVSPRPANAENFGADVCVGQSGSKYYLAVSATGALDKRGRVYLYVYESGEWKHLENENYKGIYNSSPAAYYPRGSIVWYNGGLWQANTDTFGDGSTISVDSLSWTRIDPVSTQCSLPQNIALDDDGSTLALGLVSETQLAELVKQGDEFGFSLAMSRDGSILAIGSPNSDGQYFANYRGIWRPDIEYIEGDVVKYDNIYHKLTQRIGEIGDSTTRSYNEEPGRLPWENVGDSSSESSGKVYIYQRNSNDLYQLKQTINNGSMANLNDIDSGSLISSGDQFGWSLDLDYSGSTLVISSPLADINLQNQGSVYVFRTDGYAPVEYRLKQKLESYEQYPNEYFGQNVQISANTEKIVVGAKNSPFIIPTRLDMTVGTTFDKGRTKFIESQGYSGAAYVFEIKDSIYFLAEKLDTDFTPFESFGYSVDVSASAIVVGSPDYRNTTTGLKTGNVRLFKKDASVNSLNIIGQETATIDISMIKSISMFDTEKNYKIQELDYIDHAKLKILNSAESEIKFKTSFDPAVYSIGTEEQVVDPETAWTTKNVGLLWWNLSTAKWKNYEQGDLAYRLGNWNGLAEGSTIDVYEWVETPLLPNEWSALADTNEGLAEGISGQPLYPNNDVYSVKYLFNSLGEPTDTLYYYWVKNKVVVPENMPGRNISAAAVANLISNPTASGVAFVSLIDKDKLLTYNLPSVMTSATAVINLQFRKDYSELNPIHNEYQLLSDGIADSLPSTKLETKWFDSLIGYDQAGNRVPDPDLPIKQKYGIAFRPRQSMFVNRLAALKIVVDNVNAILYKEPFADTINYENLNLVDLAPSEALNLYDVTVDTYNDLAVVGTVRTKQAKLQVNIVDGEVDTIDILDPGAGYKVSPPIVIDGDGKGAKAVAIIDNQGRISSVRIDSRGKRYNSATVSVRQFSVLVNSDSTANGFWSIYAWDDIRKTFFRSASQAYDTTRYWEYIDWYKDGYGVGTRLVKEISQVFEESTIDVSIGDVIQVKEYSSGGWAWFEKTSDAAGTFLDRFTMVARKQGTIKLKDTLYNINTAGIGYDNVSSFDTGFYDIENAKELRNILKAIKEDIFINNYAVEWNKLFFTCIRYVFSEQLYVDWAFKTSFLTAIHNIGNLEQRLNYKNDNLKNFQDYIDEVKPYRSTVRQYISRYDSVEPLGMAATDFDLPAEYVELEGRILPVNKNSNSINSYPWKWWKDNLGFSIVDIQIADAGEQYTQAPRVVIDGDGTGATAQAFVSNGKVSGIQVLTVGSGYTKAPTVTLVGGNATGYRTARAVPILGDTKTRTFDLKIKFDRLAKQGLYTNLSYSQTFVASGLTAVFELNYAPTRDKSKITITKNSQVVLTNEYEISLYISSVDDYSLLKGKIKFIEAPLKDDVIIITYQKNDELLDSINRIEKYYSPSSGMLGKELNQLMTGIDYGGVSIQGTTFDVTGGWDALPWFTDNWDSVEPSADYYHIADGSTNYVVLPYVPAEGQQINVYIKRVNEQLTTRIDDPYWTPALDSSYAVNPNAEMPTFVGDGSTNYVDIGQYIQTYAGDTLIFRPSDSDGSVTVNDPNILDTRISGGSLSAMSGAYATATGTTAEEIAIEGGKFIGPDQVPAPEENIPGQVLDSVSIKVFQTTKTGSAAIQSTVLVSDGSTRYFDIGINILEKQSVLIYIDKVKQTDYIIDLKLNQIEFPVAPDANKIIEIIAVSIGGLSLLDYQEYEADGDTSLFLTNANYADTSSVFVTVDGIQTDIGFINSTGNFALTNKTVAQFSIKPPARSIVKILALGANFDVDSTGLSVVRVNRQVLTYEGSTRSFDLDKFVNLQRASSLSSMIVEVNGVALRGVDTVNAVYDGTNNSFILGTDPFEPAGTVLPTNVRVFINGELKTFVEDYNYDGTSKELTIVPSVLVEGDTIVIENDFRAEYYVDGSNIVIIDTYPLVDEDEIVVTWFSEYPSLKIVSDEYKGGKVKYKLDYTPITIDYIWVYKNGVRLTRDQDYYVDLARNSLYLTQDTTDSDLIKIVLFGDKTYKNPSAFEIYKDMLNGYQYKRYSINSVKLAKALNYYDTSLEVTNATELTEPISSRNIPGIVHINGEKIEYMSKVGNVLSQLRRGSLGTSIAVLHAKDSTVIDVGYQNTIPYNESQDRIDFISDGSTILIGPLEYTPVKSNRNSWFRSTIPATYGPCDQIEVFVGGRRLRKDPVAVYDESLGASSPSADKTLEAEFSVNGTGNYIRLTEAVSAGTRISVIKKTGKLWYERGETTASNGVTLLESDTAIAKFIAQGTSDLPE